MAIPAQMSAWIASSTPRCARMASNSTCNASATRGTPLDLQDHQDPVDPQLRQQLEERIGIMFRKIQIPRSQVTRMMPLGRHKI